MFTVTASHTVAHYLYKVGRGGGEQGRGEERRIDTIFQREPRLTGAFHVRHSKLAGLNTGLKTH